MTNHRDSLQHGIAGRAGNNRPYCRRTAAVAMVSANVASGVTYAVDPMPSGPVGVSLVASSDPVGVAHHRSPQPTGESSAAVPRSFARCVFLVPSVILHQTAVICSANNVCYLVTQSDYAKVFYVQRPNTYCHEINAIMCSSSH